MLDKLSNEQRLLLASGLAFLFFLVYYSIYEPPRPPEAVQNSVQKQSPQQAVNSDITMNNTADNVAEFKPVPKSTSALPQNQNQLSTNKNIISTVKLRDKTYSIDHLGRIAQVTLSALKFNTEGHSLELFSEGKARPLELRFSDSKLNSLAFDTDKYPFVASQDFVEVQGQSTLTLAQTLPDLTITKIMTFYDNERIDVQIKLNRAANYYVSTGFRPSVIVDMLTVHGALMVKSNQTIEIVEDGDLNSQMSFNNIKILSVFDRYYATVFFKQDLQESNNLPNSQNFSVALLATGDNNPLAFVQGSEDFSFSAYVGPKEVKTLESIEPSLIDVVEYGIFTFLAAPMFQVLNYFHNMTNNWGWAIILLTIVIRLILFPLSAKGMIAMQKLKVVAPKLKEIQQKYKGDMQKIQAKTMELYRKEKANPLGGCLPFLLQIPIFFAIYRVLLNAIELKGSSWFYLEDLSLKDPYYIMPILMGLTMFIQQKITPSNFQDPLQEKIFKFFPLVFTIFFITFPGGLVLYWVVNNILSIIQQYIINKVLENKAKQENQKKE